MQQANAFTARYIPTARAGGHVRLSLMEKVKNATGDYPTGTYNITATYDTHFNQTAIEMTDNRQVLLKFEDLIIPEFSSLTILPLFMATALLALISHKRKHAV
jgi:hypothetical protein